MNFVETSFRNVGCFMPSLFIRPWRDFENVFVLFDPIDKSMGYFHSVPKGRLIIAQEFISGKEYQTMKRSPARDD